MTGSTLFNGVSNVGHTGLAGARTSKGHDLDHRLVRKEAAMTRGGLRSTILALAGCMLGWSVLAAIWLWRG